MQRDFWPVVEPDWNYRRTGADGRIADHLPVSPRPRSESARHVRFKKNRNAPGKTDLSSVCVSAQHQVESGVSCLAIDLRRVGQEDRDAALWNFRRRFLDVVRAIEMRVVDAREVDRILASSNGDAFVEEDRDAQSLKIGDHRDRVMIAEHAIDG